MKLSKSFTTVTPFSKYLALSLFVILPISTLILGLWLGKITTNSYQPVENSTIDICHHTDGVLPVECLNGKVVTQTNIGNIVFEDADPKKNDISLYLENQYSTPTKILLLPQVNPYAAYHDFLLSPNQDHMIFTITGPGDGHEDFLFDKNKQVTVPLKLPDKYYPSVFSQILTWVDDDTILVKETDGDMPDTERVYYWTTTVQNTSIHHPVIVQ